MGVSSGTTIIDKIHNYKIPKPKMPVSLNEDGTFDDDCPQPKDNHALEKAPNIKEKHLEVAIKEL